MFEWVGTKNRLFDLIMALAMIGLSAWILRWPGTLDASAFRYLSLSIDSSNVRSFLLVGGMLRIGALIANGHLPPYGSLCRALGALIGAVIWALMAFSLWILHNETGSVPSPGVPVYLALTLGELLSFYRAFRSVFQVGTWSRC